MYRLGLVTWVLGSIVHICTSGSSQVAINLSLIFFLLLKVSSFSLFTYWSYNDIANSIKRQLNHMTNSSEPLKGIMCQTSRGDLQA